MEGNTNELHSRIEELEEQVVHWKKVSQDLKEAMLWGDKMAIGLIWEDEGSENMQYTRINYKEGMEKWKKVAEGLYEIIENEYPEQDLIECSSVQKYRALKQQA